jgi:hypothetical protein
MSIRTHNREQLVLKVSFAALLISIPLILHGQTTKSGQMPQYLFSDFSSSRVIFKSGQILNPMMNYNIVSQRMVYIQDKKYFDLTNTEMVDTVYLQLLKFVPFGKTFFEVLQSKPIALFVQHKGELEEVGKPAGYGGTSKTASSSYLATIDQSTGTYNLPIPDSYTVIVSSIYWIRKDDKMLDFHNQKQFLNLYPDKSDLIKAFIKKHRLKIERPEDLIQIVDYTSTLK